MADSAELQRISFPVEAAVCSLDREREFEMTDAQAIEVFEVLLDRYAFEDSPETIAPRVASLGCRSVVDLVERELCSDDRATIAKVIAAVRFVACRRAAGGRHHLEILHRFCGSFVSTGVGLRILEDGSELVFGDL
jgi:hypothetical protein